MRMAGRQPNGMFILGGNSEYFANNFLRNIKWRWWSFLRAPYQYEYQKYQIVDKEHTWEPEDFPPRQQRSTCTPNSPNCQNHACKRLVKILKNNEQEEHNFHVYICLFVFTPRLVVGWEGGEEARIQQEGCQAPVMTVFNKMRVVNLTKGKIMGIDIRHRGDLNNSKVDPQMR